MSAADGWDSRRYRERAAVPWPASADRSHIWEANAAGEVAVYTHEDADGNVHDSVRCERCEEPYCIYCDSDGPREECEAETFLAEIRADLAAGSGE